MLCFFNHIRLHVHQRVSPGLDSSALGRMREALLRCSCNQTGLYGPQWNEIGLLVFRHHLHLFNHSCYPNACFDHHGSRQHMRMDLHPDVDIRMQEYTLGAHGPPLAMKCVRPGKHARTHTHIYIYIYIYIVLLCISKPNKRLTLDHSPLNKFSTSAVRAGEQVVQSYVHTRQSASLRNITLELAYRCDAAHPFLLSSILL